MDKIILKDMKFFGFHGVLDIEKERGQNFIIDVEMYADLARPCSTDNIEDTVDYSKVFNMVRDITEKERYNLIERLAQVISEKILQGFTCVKKVIVRVRKPDAPLNGDFGWSEVEIERSHE